MLTELACYNQDTTYEDILQSVFWATQKSIELVALPSGFMPRVSDFLEHQKFSAAIDFPYGLSNTEVRVHEIILAARQGASFVDLVINSGFIKEKNWSRIRKDLKACLSACKQFDIELRPIIEYRLFSLKDILFICELLPKYGIQKIVNSTGFIADDIEENIKFSKKIVKKTDLGVIPCLRVADKYRLIELEEEGIERIRLMSHKILED